MKTLKNTLIALIAITALSSNAFAGSIGIGVAGHAASVSASGTETPGGASPNADNSVVSATAGNNFMMGSIFAEMNFGDTERFTLGVDYIPGDADVNKETLSRVRGGAALIGNDQSGTSTANATLSDHITYYGEFVITNGIYAKYGFTQVDIQTRETNTLGTSTSYGDVTIDAYTLGIGQKGTFGSNGFYKVEGYMTDYDDVNIQGTGASTTGASTSAKVNASLDVVGAALKVGIKF
ncbi:MAG: hypothetical protein ACKVJK_23770 [Methylophagaceae bacterium]